MARDGSKEKLVLKQQRQHVLSRNYRLNPLIYSPSGPDIELIILCLIIRTPTSIISKTTSKAASDDLPVLSFPHTHDRYAHELTIVPNVFGDRSSGARSIVMVN